MNTGLRITVFAAALAATFGTAYGVGSSVGEISPKTDSAAHDQHADTSHGEHGGAAQEPAAPPGGLQISDAGYTLDLGTPVVEAGRTTQLRFAVRKDASGQALTDYQLEHTKELHLIIASRDLTSFRHLHPSRAADGTWSTPVALPAAGAYRVFADFAPRGGDGLTLGADLVATGAYTPAPLPAPSTTATVDGYEVRFQGELTPARASELTLTVTRQGKPVRDLQPYLGAYGHLVALRSGDLAYLHVHPNGEPGDGKTQPGPGVSFTATAPSAGTYRLFLDFKHDGKVRTAAFTVRTDAAAKQPDASATDATAPQETQSGHAH
ncbi:hypothetical protein [Streptomyces sp. NPDC006012]|uniref:hypothetical protein n=1 Tax=Streptomyces sp. NPDC006012 TaxID=3364739 RepID=UPI00368932B6